MTHNFPCTSLRNLCLRQVMAVPEEITTSSNALSLEVAADTAQLSKESGDGVADNAAIAFVDILGQVNTHRARGHMFDTP